MADFDDAEGAPSSSSSASYQSAPTSEFLCQIDYYCRNQLYRHVQKVCEDVLSRSHSDEAIFWRAVGLTAEGASIEAIRELDPLQSSEEMGLAVNAALIQAHRTAKGKDKESLEKLKEKLKKLSKDADDSALIFAGRYFLHTDKAKQSRQCLEKIYSKNPNNVQALIMLGWLNLESGQSRQARQALNYFEQALKLTQEKYDISALLGRSSYYERSIKSTNSSESRKKWEKVLDDLNSIIVLYPAFTPAIIEKSRVLMIMNQWDESLLTAQRVLKQDARNIQALRLQLLYCLTRENKISTITSKLNEFIEAIEHTESSNHALMYDVSQLVSRLCQRRRPILQTTLILIEKACNLQPDSSLYLTEQGAQLLLLEEYVQASLCFTEASKLDEGNISALIGNIKCKILQGNYKDAEQELEFLTEIQSTIGTNPELTYLHAMLAWYSHLNSEKCMSSLNVTMIEHTKQLESIPLGFQYFVAYNPDFVLEVIQLYMIHLGTEPQVEGDPPNVVLNTCIHLLQELITIVPGMVQAQLLFAKLNFVAGKFEASERTIQTVLQLDTQCATAHILQAQICLYRENYQSCSSSLEQARALDFEVRNTPVYHLMKTKLLEASGQVEDALKVLLAAMELPGVRKAQAGGAGGGAGGKGGASSASFGLPQVSNSNNTKGVVPLQDRISIYLELASVYVRLNQLPEATRVMSDAKQEFKSSTEAVRILMADADLACKRKEYDLAINMLRSIPSSHPYSIRSKIALAQIYLVNKKNKKAYIQVYQDMANEGAGKQIDSDGNIAKGDEQQAVHHYLLLGEAFMRVSEPERAITSYEQALRLIPDNAELSSKIGKALITTHDYKRAVKYYENAARGGVVVRQNEDGTTTQTSSNDSISPGTRLHLLHDLAELYSSLKQYQDSINVLESALALVENTKKDSASTGIQMNSEDEYILLSADVRSLCIMADVGQASSDMKLVVESLTQAWTLQVELLSILRGDSSSAHPERKKKELEICSTICYRLAEYYRTMNQLDKSSQFYNESLKYNESNEKSRLSLAKLHLINNDLEACQVQCITLMRLDQNNREASLMLADLMFRKNEHEAATYHFQSLLEKNPTRYDALHKLIQLLKRAGKLSEAPKFLKLAEKYNVKASFAPGFHYNKGLYAWYTNQPKEALNEFNLARKDTEWGKLATMNMIELYLNPDSSLMLADTSEVINGAGSGEDGQASNASMLVSSNSNGNGGGSSTSNSNSNSKDSSSQSEHLLSAERLLRELGTQNESSIQLKISVLEAYILLASKNKSKSELALNNLVQLCSTDTTRDYVPGLLAMSNAFLLRNEPAKARNQLKRISKMRYDPDYSDDYERAWLMLSDMYIQVGKYEFAQELCKKCLAINKSSAKSWEMLGAIMEKEQSYKDAAEHYEHAWTFMHESSPSVGYKLAFNYLKAKRYIEAIDVCHKVLTAFPEYPKIRKDILAKAREALRP